MCTVLWVLAHILSLATAIPLEPSQGIYSSITSTTQHVPQTSGVAAFEHVAATPKNTDISIIPLSSKDPHPSRSPITFFGASGNPIVTGRPSTFAASVSEAKYLKAHQDASASVYSLPTRLTSILPSQLSSPTGESSSLNHSPKASEIPSTSFFSLSNGPSIRRNYKTRLSERSSSLLHSTAVSQPGDASSAIPLPSSSPIISTLPTHGASSMISSAPPSAPSFQPTSSVASYHASVPTPSSEALSAVSTYSGYSSSSVESIGSGVGSTYGLSSSSAYPTFSPYSSTQDATSGTHATMPAFSSTPLYAASSGISSIATSIASGYPTSQIPISIQSSTIVLSVRPSSYMPVSSPESTISGYSSLALSTPPSSIEPSSIAPSSVAPLPSPSPAPVSSQPAPSLPATSTPLPPPSSPPPQTSTPVPPPASTPPPSPQPHTPVTHTTLYVTLARPPTSMPLRHASTPSYDPAPYAASTTLFAAASSPPLTIHCSAQHQHPSNVAAWAAPEASNAPYITIIPIEARAAAAERYTVTETVTVSGKCS